MATAKAAAAKAAPVLVESVELVVMEALESVKYGGKRHLPGAPLFALPDDVEGLIAAGLAKMPELVEEAPAE